MTPAEFWAEVKRLDTDATRNEQITFIYDAIDNSEIESAWDVLFQHNCLEFFDPTQVHLTATLSALMATWEFSHALPAYKTLYRRAVEAHPVELAEGCFYGLEPLFKVTRWFLNNRRARSMLFSGAIT